MMAKKSEISSEMLESILVKVTEKFTEIFKSFMNELVTTITNRVDNMESKVDAHMSAVNSRMNDLESKLQVKDLSPTDQSDEMLKTLLALELEKNERAKRSCNVVISGLHPQPGIHDAEVFEEFCENHLTVKPHLIRSSCRRLGQPADGKPARLKLTLYNSQAVDDLIQSSSLLRQSSDENAKRVYINRDYTKMEAQLAYDQREKRRSTATAAPRGPRTRSVTSTSARA